MFNLKLNWRDFAGYSICVGLAMLRFWSGHVSTKRIEMAIALLLIDLGVIAFLERTARSLKAEYLYHLRCKEENDRLDQRLNAARVRETRSKAILDDIRARIAEIDEHIKDRISKAGQIPNLIDLATKSVMDGYRHGLAIVHRQKTGAWRFVDGPDGDNGEEE